MKQEQNTIQKPVKKMGLMSKFNRQNLFDVDTKDFKWVKLEELFNTDPQKQYKVLGVFINHKSKFGDSPVAIIDGFLVNLPRHELDQVKDMLDDNEIIQYIRDGHVAFSVYEYHSTTYNRDAYSVEWLDI